MYEIVPNFGATIYGPSLGAAWLDLVRCIVTEGTVSYDESRKRIALPNVRIKAATQLIPDPIITKYADSASIQAIVDLTFHEHKMYDIDVVPSFSPGAKSYYHRIKEGRMLEFVVKRLSLIPESKKAIIVFPTYSDYEAVLANPWDDYLPCIVSVQFRLEEQEERFVLNTTFYARSIDAFQKANGNMVALAMLSETVASQLRVGKPVILGFLDGLIADAHIYEETIAQAQRLCDKVKITGLV